MLERARSRLERTGESSSSEFFQQLTRVFCIRRSDADLRHAKPVDATGKEAGESLPRNEELDVGTLEQRLRHGQQARVPRHEYRYRLPRVVLNSHLSPFKQK